MSHLTRLLLTLAIIFISLSLGWLCRYFCAAGYLRLSGAMLDRLRHILQMIAIFFLMPFAAMLSLWGLPQPEPGLLALPLLGLASYISGGILALLAARMLKLSKTQTGSFFCCGTFTNIGAVGSLVCLLFLGENSIALAALYRLVEDMYYFGIAFPVAKWFSPDNRDTNLNFRAFKLSPAPAIIVCALLSGIGMNLMAVPRPEICDPLASAGVLAATIFLLFAIGLTLRLGAIWNYIPASLTMCAIKFLLIPMIVIPLAASLGYGCYDNGLPLKAVAILCAMPVAMTALAPPALFRLDIDLANACWLFSTAGLVVALPLLALILPRL